MKITDCITFNNNEVLVKEHKRVGNPFDNLEKKPQDLVFYEVILKGTKASEDYNTGDIILCEKQHAKEIKNDLFTGYFIIYHENLIFCKYVQ